ncbi:hypothetical protein QBC36DRAFT_80013 [Triangularia setosa]|uniref:Uncharacterized protein n=1 Tax=Triangularia setosa TaxID=2587417 RepID=A0AAN6VYS2_9PEZI|nr:hypothetical protein QBC36DRAFT_80013 [Podospora setosa]
MERNFHRRSYDESVITLSLFHKLPTYGATVHIHHSRLFCTTNKKPASFCIDNGYRSTFLFSFFSLVVSLYLSLSVSVSHLTLSLSHSLTGFSIINQGEGFLCSCLYFIFRYHQGNWVGKDGWVSLSFYFLLFLHGKRNWDFNSLITVLRLFLFSHRCY